MRDERAKKVGLYGSSDATNCQFAAAVGNDSAIGGGSYAAAPSSAGNEIGSSYNLLCSSDGAEKIGAGRFNQENYCQSKSFF
jgi:hypothetical protein